ncbi:MAG: hypothetical protein IAF38_06850 [Bacteroidia bacterium]|nr:hypothetical protein [Bacteroidia bacterium]
MFLEFFRFELQTGKKKISFWIFFALLFLLGLSLGFLASGIWGPDNTESNAFVNTSYSISSLLMASDGNILGLFNSIFIISLMSDGIYKDFKYNSHSLFFTKPISKAGYFFGRFFGGYFFAVMVFVGELLGLMVGIQSGSGHTQVGPFSLMNYLQPFLLFIIPNIFFQGIVYFSLNTFTRNPMFSYAFAVVVLVGRVFADNFGSDLDYKTFASFLDPSGSNAFRNLTEYWTPVEQNQMMVPFSGVILYNRLLWIGLALLMTVFCYARFSFSQFLAPVSFFGLRFKKRVTEKASSVIRSIEELPKVTRHFNLSSTIKQILYLARFEFRNATRSIFFFIAVVLGCLFLLVVPFVASAGNPYGTNTYPMTNQMIEIGAAVMQFMIMLLALFSTGTMLYREKDSKVDELVGASPVTNSVLFWSKYLGMMLTEMSIFVIMIISSIIYQLATGFKDINIAQYISTFFGMRLLTFGVMTLFYIGLQTLFSNKFVGWVFGFILVLVLPVVFRALEWSNPLYLVNSSGAALTYSDLNSFGHYPTVFLLLKMYWIAAGLLLVIFSIRFYSRGKEKSLKSRFRLSKYTFNGKAKLALAATLIVFLTCGSFIYYNISVLNKRHNSAYFEKLGFDYEKKYKHFESTPQPRLIASNVNVNIFPEKRGAEIDGFMWLKNKTSKNIDTIIVNEISEIKINSFAFAKPAVKVEEAKDYGMHIYKLNAPLAPGDSIKFSYNLSYFPKGFKSDDPETSILYNGTFFNNGVLPNFGYSEGNEIDNNKTRKKYGLKDKPRMNSVFDTTAYKNTYISHDADWINFECVVSTSADQTAIAPGYLQKTWEKDGRKYFAYKMDCKILNFYPFLSAKYTVIKDQWVNPLDANNKVNIEIYYHSKHAYNIDRMIKGIKLALNYYTKNFSPYQHRQVRILEFPRYATFAQSFPNTIPFSEGIGFIMKVDKDDPESIDMPLYVTAHEVAHQWWAHQVIGADVAGSTLMSETMSQYSALMVMEKEYGKQQIKKFLEYELNRYLIGRATESRKELPIMFAENQQYIHYNKGSLVMYALRDYIGEDTLNAVLKRYIKKVAYQEPPYTTSLEFVNYLKQTTPDSLKYVITDLFETITLYNNSIKDLSYKQLSNGKYKVSITVNSVKYRADSLGTQKEIPINDYIDIGIFAEKIDTKGKKSEKELYLKKMKVTKLNQVFEIIVDEKPSKAGIDPYNKLIDRTPQNNTRAFGAPYEKDAPSLDGLFIKVGDDES